MMEWISVKERMPVFSGNYLTLSREGVVMVLKYSAKHRAFNSRDFFSEEDNERYKIKGITYWSNIPKLPVDYMEEV